MYTDRNFKTKKAMVEAFERGEKVYVYQPGPFGEGGHIGHVGAVHQCYLEGPHYPEPHKWYASGFYAIASTQLIELKGSKAKWVNGVFIPAPPKVKRVKNPDGSTTETRSHLDRTERLQKMFDHIEALPTPAFQAGDRVVYAGLRSSGVALHGTIKEHEGWTGDGIARYRVTLEWPEGRLLDSLLIETNLTKEV